MGPLFYLLYTREIEEIVLKHNLSIQSYADDCQIYTSFYDYEKTKTEERMERCLEDLQIWMNRNYLKLNPQKTIVKIFKPNNSKIQDFKVFNKLDTNGPVKILGALYNDGWKFQDFISKKAQGCNYHIRNLYNIKESLDTKTRILLITNLVLSKIDFCNVLLLGATNKDLRPLRMVINKSLRFIYNLSYREHITPYYKKAHFLPIRARIQFKAALIAFKIYYDQAPKYFSDEFTKFSPTAGMTLRENCGRDRFMFKLGSNDINVKLLFSKIISEWNALPLQIRMISTKTLFKSKLKSFLFSN